jgi:hypothetical protein
MFDEQQGGDDPHSCEHMRRPGFEFRHGFLAPDGTIAQTLSLSRALIIGIIVEASFPAG